MLYLSTISPSTLELLNQLLKIDEFSGLRLAGGTALALQIGHRKSIDLDFFGEVNFTDLNGQNIFKGFKSVESLKVSKNINIFEINDVKVDFVNYSYPWLTDPIILDGIRMAQMEDIAAMKLAAITGRGTRKDFIDLYFLLRKFTLEDIFQYYQQKYADASPYLVLKSLVYFDDAENDISVNMIENISWEEVKSKISNEVIDFLNK